MTTGRPYLLAVACALVCLPAAAQPARSEADVLFDRGVEDMEAGRFASACPQIAESLKLDPKPGTTFTLAECEARWPRPAAALRHYGDYLALLPALPAAQQAKHAERKQRAQDAIKKLESQVARLSLSLSPKASPGTEVSLDGSAADLGKAQAVDPGDHTIVVKQGSASRTETVSLAAGESKTLTLEPPAASPAPPPAASSSGPPPDPPGPSNRKLVMYGGAGLAAVGLLAGTVGGIVAFSKKSDADKGCTGLVCTHQGYQDVESGRRAALIGTIGFAAAVVGGGVAATLFFLDRRESSSEALRVVPAASVGEAGLLVRGSF